MPGVTVKVIDKLTPRLDRALGQLEDYRQPLTTAGYHQQRSFMRQFEAGGKPIRWKPLAPATIARRRKKSSKPLLDTGRLRRSYISSRSGSGIWSLEPRRLTIGSNVHYAATHQFGATIRMTTRAGRRLMRRTKRGQYRFMKSGSKRKAALGVFWSGGKSYTVTIPARPLRILREDRAEHVAIFGRYVRKALGE